MRPKKDKNETYSIQHHYRANAYWDAKILENFKKSPYGDFSTFARQTLANTPIINYNYQSFKPTLDENARLLKSEANNLNQIAHALNELALKSNDGVIDSKLIDSINMAINEIQKAAENSSKIYKELSKKIERGD